MLLFALCLCFLTFVFCALASNMKQSEDEIIKDGTYVICQECNEKIYIIE